MDSKKTDVCIIGTGPTAKLCCLYLKNTDYILVGNHENTDSLSPVDINGTKINLVPIFPAFGSSLYNKLFYSNNPSKSFLNLKFYGDTSNEILSIVSKISMENCYAALSENKTNCDSFTKNIVLSYKLYGDIIFKEELKLLQEKVLCHYTGSDSFRRVGYNDGLSPYNNAIEDIKISKTLQSKITGININSRYVETINSRIYYNKLISTIPVPKLFELILESPSFRYICADASFCLVLSDNNIANHQVIYDVEIRSPIYRIFTIGNNRIIVQLSSQCSKGREKCIIDRLSQLLNSKDNFTIIKKYSLQNAYPLDIKPFPVFNDYKTNLESKGVYLFGRYGQWEYKDLHELGFDKLYDKIFN